MTVFNVTMWWILLALLVPALVLAVLANRPGRHWLAVPPVAVVAAATGWAILGGAHSAPGVGLLIAAGIGLTLLAVVGGSPLVSLVLELAGGGTVSIGDHGVLLTENGGRGTAPREILRGGMTIGYLERLAVIGSILAGQPAAVAVIVAVKGLGRFAELENSAARERFIIGTLVSLIWAAACAAPLILAR